MKDLGNVFILGDSYSTYAGYIPEGYGCWYPSSCVPEHNMDTHEKTWWWRVLSSFGANLVQNNSWSGSTICNTGYDGADFTHESYLTRAKTLLKDGKFGKYNVDTLFVFGGTNDCWAGVPLGTYKYGGWTTEDGFSFAPALCELFDYLKREMPSTRIICIVNCDLTEELTEIMLGACSHYGIETVVLKNVDKVNGHPSAKGMYEIAEQVASIL